MDPTVIKEYVELGVQIVGVASMVAAVTPTPVDDGILLIFKRILNIFAFNFGHAKNAK